MKVRSVLDLLPKEGVKQVDKLGYDFLTKQGLDCEGATESREKRAKIARALKRQNRELRYSGAINKETNAILVWFELYQNGVKIASSQGIKFVPKEGCDG